MVDSALSLAQPVRRRSRPVRLLLDALFVVAGVFVLSAAFLYAGLQVYGVRFYEVKSPSMVPAFGKGDVVAVKSIAPHAVHAGDVIAFHEPGFAEPYVHRVARINSSPDIRNVVQDKQGKVVRTSMTYSQRMFYTKGDANPVEDSQPVTDSALIGKELFVVPWPFNLIVTRLTKYTLFLLGVGSIMAFIAWEVFDMAKAGRRALRQDRGSRT